MDGFFRSWVWLCGAAVIRAQIIQCLLQEGKGMRVVCEAQPQLLELPGLPCCWIRLLADVEQIEDWMP